MTDPYLNHTTCVARLIREWEKHGRLIVALDYDGTCKPFPESDEHTHELVLGLARECSDLGFLIVLYTASSPDRYPMMREHLAREGIKVASVNENPITLPFGLWGKPYFNITLDDRGGLPSAYAQLREVVNHIKAEQAKGA